MFVLAGDEEPLNKHTHTSNTSTPSEKKKKPFSAFTKGRLQPGAPRCSFRGTEVLFTRLWLWLPFTRYWHCGRPEPLHPASALPTRFAPSFLFSAQEEEVLLASVWSGPRSACERAHVCPHWMRSHCCETTAVWKTETPSPPSLGHPARGTESVIWASGYEATQLPTVVTEWPAGAAPTRTQLCPTGARPGLPEKTETLAVHTTRGWGAPGLQLF